MTKVHRSHGTGAFDRSKFANIGDDVLFEEGVLVFHPETISLGHNVYVGHRSILKGYYKASMVIGDNSWIGQNCFFHSAGGIEIGPNVGIGPSVQIITSYHAEGDIGAPILFNAIQFKEVVIGEGSDIGIGTIVLPGVRIGKGVQIGAGSVVTKDIEDYAVAYGSPARVVRLRAGHGPHS